MNDVTAAGRLSLIWSMKGHTHQGCWLNVVAVAAVVDCSKFPSLLYYSILLYFHLGVVHGGLINWMALKPYSRTAGGAVMNLGLIQ